MENEITDSDIKRLVMEALDFNAGVISLSTMYFGNCDSKKVRDNFIKEYRRISSESEKRRRAILGISQENT